MNEHLNPFTTQKPANQFRAYHHVALHLVHFLPNNPHKTIHFMQIYMLTPDLPLTTQKEVPPFGGTAESKILLKV